MAVAFRLNHSFSWSLALVFATRFLCGVSAAAPALAGQQLTRVQDPNVIFDTDSNGTTLVYSPVTGQQIPQGLATDGSGSGFSTSAVLWIVFSFVVGAPLLLVGFRGRRLTLGAAVGTAAALACKHSRSCRCFVVDLDDDRSLGCHHKHPGQCRCL